MRKQKKIAAGVRGTDGDKLKSFDINSPIVTQAVEKVKAVIKQPGKIPEVAEISNTECMLCELQRLVDGHIEVVRLFGDFIGIVDEEGKIKNKPINVILHKDYICGNVVCIKERDEDFVGLTAEEITEVKKWLFLHSI